MSIRLAFLAVVLCAAGALGQADPCTLKCGDTMGACAGRCETDQRCAQRCVKQMDSCNARCAATGKAQLQPKNMPKQCPGQNGKMIPCSAMTTAPKPPPVEKESESTNTKPK